MYHNKYQEYSRIEHEVPYVYQIDSGEYSLYYYGTSHTNSVTDNIFKDIPYIIESFKPNAVVVEGVPQLNTINKRAFLEGLFSVDENKICLFGENVYTVYMANKYNIEVLCLDPTISKEVYEILSLGYSLDLAFLYYMSKFIYQSKKFMNDLLYVDYIDRGINYFNNCIKSYGVTYSKEDLKVLFNKVIINYFMNWITEENLQVSLMQKWISQECDKLYNTSLVTLSLHNEDFREKEYRRYLLQRNIVEMVMHRQQLNWLKNYMEIKIGN